MIDLITLKTTCTGADGSAAGTDTSPPVRGKVHAVHVTYTGDDPATTDVTLKDESDPAAETILTLSNAATDVKIYPRRVLETNDGTDLTYDGTRKVYGQYVVHGRLTLTVAQANTGDIITALVWIEI